jgi:chromosome segregation ATPase
MTCKEKLIADHPEWTEERIANYIKYSCPSTLGYMEDPDWCWDVNDTEKCSRECWNREIPENKKEKENMCMCREFLEYEDRVKKLEEENKGLKETNEDLANKLGGERAKNIKLQDMVCDQNVDIDKLVTENEKLRKSVDVRTIEEQQEKLKLRDEEINKLVKENERLNEDTMNLTKADEINMDTINMLRDRIDKLVEENEKLNGRLTAFKLRNDTLETNWRVVSDENKILRVEKATQAESIKDLLESNDKFKEDIESRNREIAKHVMEITELTATIKAKDKQISELCDRLNEANIEIYIENDIAEKFNSCSSECALHPTDIARTIARHMRNKYDALIYVGFSHDDAMSLIPMWTD